jgi:hypothetical protein
MGLDVVVFPPDVSLPDDLDTGRIAWMPGHRLKAAKVAAS